MATTSGNEPRMHFYASEHASGETRNLMTLGLGIGLVAIGALLLAQELTGVEVWQLTWPFFVIVPGLLLFVAMALKGKRAGPLAIPASIVTTTGLILLVQSTFGVWQTWAYVWTLIAPTSVGLGQWIYGAWSDRPDLRETGLRLTEIGLILFLGLAAFFELLINLSGWMRGTAGSTALAVVLVVLGSYLLVRAGHRGSVE